MPKFYRIFSLLFLILYASLHLSGNEAKYLRLNEKVFCTVNAKHKLSHNLTEGIKTFLFEVEQKENQIQLISAENSESLEIKLAKIKAYCNNTDSAELKLVFTGTYDEIILSTFLNDKYGSLLKIAKLKDIVDIDIKPTDKTQILCFLSSTITKLSDTLKVEADYQGRFTSTPNGKMLVIETSENNVDSLKKDCINIWESTGRIPNFILYSPQTKVNTLEVVNWLNKLRRFRGEIKYHSKILNEIYWKQMPGTVTSGRFSFPILDYSLVLSPYKNGYLITPGEIIHHTSMEDVVRPFIAFNTQFEDGLNYSFQFEQNARNEADLAHVNCIENGSKWVSDKERGNVILFDSLNSFIDYNKPNQLNFNTPISFSMWLKPYQVKAFMGILGIGTSFSLKLKNGKLDFTTAQIKDHINNTGLKLNEWTHVGFVFNPGSTINFYVNGQKEKTMLASEIQDSQQSLIIGNNIWGEQYFGCIDELMIWDRGLSESEFDKLYLQQLQTNKTKNTWLLLIIPFILILLFILTRRKLKPIKRKKLVSGKIKNTPVAENRIEIFGQFNVVSKAFGNISTSFSPLLKQLLSFFILKTILSDGTGISSKEINDIFWPGFSKEQAKDNRGTNIKKLRSHLTQIPGIQIVFKDKKWFIEINPEIKVDLFEYQVLKNSINKELAKKIISNEKVKLLLKLLSHGNILQDLESEWLDSFKGKYSEEITLLLVSIIEYTNKNNSLNIEVAKTILLFDNLNEDALKILIQNLIESGNHGLAKQAYNEFSKRYGTLYSEKFPIDFNNTQKQ